VGKFRSKSGRWVLASYEDDDDEEEEEDDDEEIEDELDDDDSNGKVDRETGIFQREKKTAK
jgi:hypothetical protein